MRGLPLLLAAGWTLAYGYVTQTAIAADLDRDVVRVARLGALRQAERPAPLDAGTLPPIVVEAMVPDLLDAGTLPPIVVEAPAPGTDSAAVI
jgi:hypothetical protein